MKKTGIAAFLLIFALLFAGCVSSGGKYQTFLCISNMDDRSFSMEYTSFDGKKYYVITPKKDTELRMRFVTKSGSLKCTVTEKGTAQDVYYQKEIQDSEASVPMKKGVKYTVWLIAEAHEGAFYFDWS